MDSAKKLDFVHKMTKMGLQHFDSGGTVLNGPNYNGTNQNATNPNTGILGTVNGALGLNDNYQAGSANIQQGTNTAQLNNAYQGVQQGLGYQQDLASTLAPQATSAVASQNQLAAQLQAQANGQGPNVAQNQLNQATGQNVANQSAMAAGQRGASSNVGLLARQAAMQGSGIQQQAAGQAATLGAEQQIAAQQGEANLASNQISQAGQAGTNLTSAQQGEQNILQNANTSANNAAVTMQSNLNNVNSQTAAANQNSASNMFGGITSGFGGVGSIKFADGGDVDSDEDSNLGEFHAAQSSSSSPSVAPTSSLPANQTNYSDSSGGSSGGSGAGALAALLAKGGAVQKGYMQRFAIGGITGNPLISQGPSQPTQSFVGQYLNSSSAPSSPAVSATSSLPENQTDYADSYQKQTPKQDQPQQVAGGSDPSDKIGDGDGTMRAATGGPVKKQLAAKGGGVRADNEKEKAKVKGNSYANDKVPALLSEGEIVLPREVTQSKDPVGNAAKFVQAVMAKKGLQKGMRR